MNPQHSKFALLKNYDFELPKMKAMTLHSFHCGRLKTTQSPEPKMPKLQQITFQSTLIVKRLQPRCRQRKVQMRTISLHKINNTTLENRTIIPLNQSMDIKGWSQKSVMEIFDI
ncbi:unnamed protein product [Paramecium primaurelia]|uniref:Uncharacterized protein n=1 Tax=Paramecium primaurelia TaxID=5886 RepID=A0A8S1L4T0_PARPR|nr:unnamed protein product [Paramecium primaurelia]